MYGPEAESRHANLIQTAGPSQPLEYPCLEDGSELHWKKSNPKPSDRFSQSSNTLERTGDTGPNSLSLCMLVMS